MSSEAATDPVLRGSVPDLPLLQPMEIGELLDESFDLYRRHFRLFFGIAILLDLPLTILQIAYSGPGTDLTTADWVLLAARVTLLLTFVPFALTCAARDCVLGKETTIAAAYGEALRRTGPLFVAVFIYASVTALLMAAAFLPGILLASTQPVLAGILLILGLMIGTIPSVILTLWWIVLIPVIVVERRSVDVLSRCWRLAAGNMWRLLFLFLGLSAVWLLCSLVTNGLRGIVTALTGTNAWLPPDQANVTATLIYAGVTLFDALALEALFPLLAIASYLAYLDLRIRREAYDLELLTEAVEARVAARREPPSPPTPGTAAGVVPDAAGRSEP